MSELDPEHIRIIFEQAGRAQQRLVLVLGPSGSGKTAWLKGIAADHNFSYLAIGGPLAASLMNRSPLQRPLSLGTELDELLPPRPSPVCLDNLDLLFLPELHQDPLRCIGKLSEYRLIVAAFSGTFNGTEFSRASHDHPECYRSRISGTPVIHFGPLGPSLVQT
jgi:hypothetical protein